MNSPEGYSFRSYMDTWDRHQLLEAIKDHKNKIKAMIDGGPMILFMKHKDDNQVYGGDENSRVTYARMKHPDEDEGSEWADQANFMATNMSKLVNGEGGCETVFGKKDLSKLDVLDDKDELIDMLVKAMKGGNSGPKTVIITKGQPDQDLQEL